MVDASHADGTGFRRSSFCSSGGCVEVAVLPGGWIAIRDSKAPRQLPQIYSVEEWEAFLSGVKAGEFDVSQ